MSALMAGDVLIVQPDHARLDVVAAPAFRSQLLQHIQQGHRRIHVDLRRVETIDSSGLGALVAALKQLGGSGLEVSHLRDRVRTMFELTRLDTVIPIVDRGRGTR